jgi:flagellar hook-associated protein 2
MPDMTTGINMSLFSLQNSLFLSQTLLSALTNTSSNSSSGIGSLNSLLGTIESNPYSTSNLSQNQASTLAQLNLNSAAMALNSSNSTSIFSKSTGTPDATALVSDVNTFVTAFNKAVSLESSTSSSSGTGNLATLALNNADSLNAIGITVGSDGTLSVDQTKLEDAIANNPQAVEDAFNGSSSFASNTQSQAMRSVYNTIAGTNLLSMYTGSSSSTNLSSLTGLLYNTTL